MSAIYIHIPYCRQACHYCDFHFSTSHQTVEPMIEAIVKELILRKDYLGNEKVETIYFGGGTPSLLSVSEITTVMDAIQKTFKVADSAEVTLEANPDDLTLEKAKELIGIGINRLSIGIQSFHDEDLQFMNRSHSSRQAITSLHNVRQAGFKNISLDLIYGIQNQAPGQWEKNLDIAFSMDIDHLSCYALTVEPRTALADMIRKGKVVDQDDEKTIRDFKLLMNRAVEEGYEHYEISNFARNKKYSVHNTSYWQGKKYLGVGPSAHSFDNISRQWNVSNNRQYLLSIKDNKVPFEREILTEKNKFNEYVLTKLRTMWGIDQKLILEKFGQPSLEIFQSRVKKIIEEGLINEENDKLTLTREGKFVADRIAAELFQ